jgi:hypothetical protein
MHKQLFSLVILSLVLLHQSTSAQADNSEIAAESASLKHFVNLFTIGGRPLNTDASKRATILVNTGYVVGYSEDRRTHFGLHTWRARESPRLGSRPGLNGQSSSSQTHAAWPQWIAGRLEAGLTEGI